MYLDIESEIWQSSGYFLAERKIVDIYFHASCACLQIEPNKPLFLLCLEEVVQILTIDKRYYTCISTTSHYYQTTLVVIAFFAL